MALATAKRIYRHVIVLLQNLPALPYFRTFGLPDFRTFGLSDFSDFRTFPTFGLSDFRTLRLPNYFPIFAAT